MMKMNLQGQPKWRIPDSELPPFTVGGNHHSADSNFHFHVQNFKDSSEKKSDKGSPLCKIKSPLYLIPVIAKKY